MAEKEKQIKDEMNKTLVVKVPKKKFKVNYFIWKALFLLLSWWYSSIEKDTL